MVQFIEVTLSSGEKIPLEIHKIMEIRFEQDTDNCLSRIFLLGESITDVQETKQEIMDKIEKKQKKALDYIELDNRIKRLEREVGIAND